MQRITGGEAFLGSEVSVPVFRAQVCGQSIGTCVFRASGSGLLRC